MGSAGLGSGGFAPSAPALPKPSASLDQGTPRIWWHHGQAAHEVVEAIAAMIGLFWAADLTGPARPLSFATSNAQVPAALAFELVYLAALVIGITATVHQCRGPDGVIALPTRPELADSLRLFAAAVALDFVYVACTATAVIEASRGDHTLDFLAALGSVASSTSALVAGYGLAKPALAAREAERADHEILLSLWEAVTDSAVRSSTPPPVMTWWNRRYALSDLLAEIFTAPTACAPGWMRHRPRPCELSSQPIPTRRSSASSPSKRLPPSGTHGNAATPPTSWVSRHRTPQTPSCHARTLLPPANAAARSASRRIWPTPSWLMLCAGFP